MVKGYPQIQQNVGGRIRELREKRNHTQESLALKSGLDRTYINLVENGRRENYMQNINDNNSCYMTLSTLKILISKLESEISEDCEVWLSCDEEGNEFLPMSANTDLSVAFDNHTKRVIFFPMHC
jgi:transcriptional regulator with XRE-family HTH domain